MEQIDNDKKQLIIARKNVHKLINRVKILEMMMKEHGWKMPLIEPEYIIDDNGFPIA